MCRRYTLLVGHPPFETQSLKDTYGKIKRNEYHIPSRIAPTARSLITRMLRPDPADRFASFTSFPGRFLFRLVLVAHVLVLPSILW